MSRKDWDAKYNVTHKEERANHRAFLKENDPHYNAGRLLRRYRQSDIQYNRGQCTLTAEWIEENIYKKGCLYCNETDWHKLGCDRVDNSKPHTPNNVVPCCKECNQKRQRRKFLDYFYERFMDQILY